MSTRFQIRFEFIAFQRVFFSRYPKEEKYSVDFSFEKLSFASRFVSRDSFERFVCYANILSSSPFVARLQPMIDTRVKRRDPPPPPGREYTGRRKGGDYRWLFRTSYA